MNKPVQLKEGQRNNIRSAAQYIGGDFPWERTAEGKAYWKAVFDSLNAMAKHGTSNGKPLQDGPQSVDSSLPMFKMPDDWYGRRVQCFHRNQRVVGRLFGYMGKRVPEPFFIQVKYGKIGNDYHRSSHIKILPERNTYFHHNGMSYEVPDFYDTETSVWVSNESFGDCVSRKITRVMTTIMNDNGTPAYLVIPETYGENARYQYALIPPKEPQE